MYKILAIDDNKDNLIVVTALLKDLIPDANVITSLSGAEGLEKARTENPDTILLDVKMPGMDGFEVCERLKSDLETKHIPIIMVTAARTDSLLKVKGLELGADAFLAKPIDESELVAQIKVMLRIKKAEDQLRGEKKSLEELVEEKLSELKQSEKDLRDINNRLNIGVENMPNAYIQLDNDLRVLEWNREAEKIFGYTKIEMLGKNPIDYIVPEDIRHLVEPVLRKLKTGEVAVYSEPNNNIRKDGKLISCQWSNAPLLDEEGNIIGVIALAQDITERKQAEEEQKRLFTAIGQAADSIMMTDSEGIVQYVNPAFEKLSGYSKEEAIGLTPRILKSGEHEEAFYRLMWETLTRGEIWSDFVINKRKDGTLYEVDMTISPILNEVGVITNYVAVKRDVTHERELEKQLRQAQKMEAIGTLAGGIAHDFNNLLFAITGYTALAKAYLPGNVTYQDHLEQVLLAGSRAKDLVRQILTFSRQTESVTETLQIAPLIKETLKFLRASLPTTIDIIPRISRDCGDIMADHTQIHQILMNLCTNAGYAMQDNGGLLEVILNETAIDENFASIHEVQPGRYVQLTIKDTGTGMSAEILEHIFEPFYTTKPEGRGTGMGLSVVHGIIQSYQGAITVQSQKDQGTTFDLFFPVIDVKAQAETKNENIQITGSENILIIDDEVTLANLLREMLRSLGYRVTIASDSQHALNIFQTNPRQFDLVISDQTMPQMSGDQLAKKLLRIRPDLPIILTTGYSHKIDKEEIQRIGIRNLLIKPFEIKLLGETVRKSLD